MNMKLDLDFKKWLPILRTAQPYVFGVILVGLFAYTAVEVNTALNPKADETAAATTAAKATKVVFDKNTIEAVKQLEEVPGTVPTGDLGKIDPFK